MRQRLYAVLQQASKQRREREKERRRTKRRPLSNAEMASQLLLGKIESDAVQVLS